MNLGNPNAPLPDVHTPPPIVQMAAAFQEFLQKHNLLAQKMQIMAAQHQTLVEVLKEKTSVTDEELGAKFREVAESLGFTIVDRDAEAEEEVAGDEPTDLEASSDESDGGADSSLSDEEQDHGALEGAGGEPRPEDGGTA